MTVKFFTIYILDEMNFIVYLTQDWVHKPDPNPVLGELYNDEQEYSVLMIL